MSWVLVVPDLGTIFETVVSAAKFPLGRKSAVRGSEVIYHDQEKPWTHAGPLWNSSGDWDEF